MFGKRVIKKDEPKKVRKEVYNDSGNVKRSINKNDSVNGSSNNINNNDNTSDIGINQNKVNQDKVKPKKTYGFMKKTSSKSSGLLFGQTKEEKLELFIKNTKIIHPNIPNFWLQKDIEKFKKKFNIEELI